MPKTHRQFIYRKLAQAYINANYSGTFIKELEEEYRFAHPDLADALANALYGLALVTDILEQFGKTISGAPEINWGSWAGTNRPRRDIRDEQEFDDADYDVKGELPDASNKDEQEYNPKDYTAEEPIPDEISELHPDDK